MGDGDEVSEKPYFVERAKQGRAACKKCKQKCEAAELRIAKLVPSPYDVLKKMKSWHHLDCLFELFMKQRVTTKRLDSLEDLDGFDLLSEDDQLIVIDKINESEKAYAENHGLDVPIKIELTKVKKNDSPSKGSAKKANKTTTNAQKNLKNDNIKDSLFKEFRRLVVNITNESSYLKKSKIVEDTFKSENNEARFTGNISLWCKLLLPGVQKRIYNLHSKQLIKLFSKIFKTSPAPMMTHLKEGDVSETIQLFFEKNTAVKPCKKSTLTVEQVEEFLENLSKLTKEEDQINHFSEIVPICTAGDLKVIIRLIKHDLRMNAGAKHILDGIHPDAYTVYQSSRDLNVVINRCLLNLSNNNGGKEVDAKISVMTPMLPMLAQPCKSVEDAIKKCPNGMYSEIKYDGERVQVHKKGSKFQYFSRSLKPVLNHKIEHFKKYIPQAFPLADDLILDSEILMVDSTGKPLPFGTLGIHKKTEFESATVCLFVFDCIYYNGEDLRKKPINYRKKILREQMTEVPNRVMFSEMKEIRKVEELSSMIKTVLKEGLEGLVLKDMLSQYEPGKRHWLKMKKDYLFGGAMADSADLIVLGAWYGTGKKGGMMSTFLMGCYDNSKDIFLTVTKVHSGHDDDTLQRLQNELDMVKINCDPTKVPSWLKCSKTMTPDFVAKDPRCQPVWQIIGAEFTQHDVHTADGISIRFPRVTKVRDDKNWESATNLDELRHLMEESKNNIDKLFDKDDVASSSKDSGITCETSHQDKDEFNDSGEKISKKPAKRKNQSLEDSSAVETKRTKRRTTTEKVELKNPIKTLFENVNVIIADKVMDDDNKTWLRYFQAYGGVILDNNFETATHVLHLSENDALKQCPKCPRDVRHVHIDWIKGCIFNQSLLNCINYGVNLIHLDNNFEEFINSS